MAYLSDREQKRERQLGFTLLEVIVVVLIIGILSGVAIPNFLAWLHQYRLRSAAIVLTNHLRAARLLAIFTGTIHQVQMKDWDEGNYYQVVQNPGDSTEQVVMSIGRVVLKREFGEVLVRELTPASGEITFRPKGTSTGSTIILENAVQQQIRIRMNNFGRIYHEIL